MENLREQWQEMLALVDRLQHECEDLKDDCERHRRDNFELRTRCIIAERHKLLDRLGKSSYQEVVEEKLRVELAEAHVKLEAAEARLSSQGWQPIETAPKDGTPVLVWDGSDAMVSYWSNVTGLDGDGEWHTWALCAEQPTHWMPLPQPPKEGPK